MRNLLNVVDGDMVDGSICIQWRKVDVDEVVWFE